MKIRAVCFDIDGTLYPYFWMYLTSIKLFFNHPSFAYHYRSMRKQIRAMDGIHDFRRKQADLLAEKLDIPPSRAFRLIEERIYGQWIDSFAIIKPFPYLKQVLRRLDAQGFTLAVLSDYPVEKKLAFLGLSDIWAATLSAESVHRLKPHPASFLKLCALLDMAPEDILYVGDTYGHDIIGAKRVGMKTAHLSTGRKKAGISDFTFSHYGDFYSRIIEKII
ncbi:MAG: HAD family hydrolase [Spirochaetales bacterium]|nr:HAD family hydrolase [Spirochaetales bacterium]